VTAPGGRAPHSVTRAARYADTALFFVAALMSLTFVYTTIGPIPVLVVSGVFAAVRWAAAAPSANRVLRGAGRAMTAGFNLVAAYLALVCVYALGWTMPWWSKLLAGALLLCSIATLALRARRVRLPLALGPAVITLTCALGWRREEGIVRCDDRLRVQRQRGVELLFPSTEKLAACAPGDAFPIHRFPRKIWESPDASRYVLTTTTSQGGGGMLELPDAAYDGLFCEVSADGTGRPHCVGGNRGKTHEIDEIGPLDQLFSCAWGMTSSDGRRGSVVYRLSRSAPLTVLAEHRVDDGFVMYGFYDPATDAYHAFTDECGSIRSIRGADFSALPDLPVSTCPGATLYDADADEGVMCGGLEGFAAFRLHPWTYRPIARSGNPTGRAWLSWGCDWDHGGRKVYATVANLGLLVVIDYDTGRVERTHFVGFGRRSVAFDAIRRRVYVAGFLDGDVLSVDADSGIERARWFVGHYVRELRLSRDHSKLLTASSQGIVRIALD
jgi:hypothetical protein